MGTRAGAAGTAPVEFSEAVRRYLDACRLGPDSRRVYRISLARWAWVVVDRTPPAGAARRGAMPPLVPLAVLDEPTAAARIARTHRERAETGGSRTANRELSVLRGACAWWYRAGWIQGDPVAGLRMHPVSRPEAAPGGLPEESARSLAALFRLPVPAREQALWRLAHESDVGAAEALALDVTDVDLGAGTLRLRLRHPDGRPAFEHRRYGRRAAAVLPALLLGRASGPLFLTDRRAPAGTPARDRCPISGRGRLSVRRAEDLLATASRPLDPDGRGWTFGRLRAAGRST
ncbi:hypothetical protein [Allostreptomyces psammosilenae]|uniref:Integrase/recombinase XerD n=1 Tax=Allostreptomyces psammosilenae TaxID=1892865 RepID=A0A852ZY38_9ACTN|nr:hypothetical protein [Allostreptomyces psammosilenae]NYI03541.1 integrase/recombinase XerD [Allostreptomyces psammosilenae]